MLVLDTDHISVLLWEGTAIADRLVHRLAYAEQDVAVTLISYEEQCRGWLGALNQSRSMADQIDKYRRLERHLAFYGNARVLPFDEVAAARYQTLRKAYRRLGTMDLKLAAVVLVHDATLLSANLSDFSRIEGLRVEDWIHRTGAL